MFSQMARILELCACNPKGIKILVDRLKEILCLIKLYLKPETDFIDTKYPILTVLLDITANEQNIISVAENLCSQKVM
jgi:hypothetical protein